MAKLGEVFPSKWLKAEELDGDTVLTITEVKIEVMGQGRDADSKPVLYFQEIEKGFVANKTNSNTLAKLLRSDDTDDWVGHQITIYPTDVEFKGEMVPGIRVRATLPRPAKASAKPATAAAPSRPAAATATRPVRQPVAAPAEEGEDESGIPF